MAEVTGLSKGGRWKFRSEHCAGHWAVPLFGSRARWMEQMSDVQMCNYPSSVELLLVPVSYSFSAFVACCLALRASHLNPAIICAFRTKLPLALQYSCQWRHPWQGLLLPTLHLWNSPGSQAGPTGKTWQPRTLGSLACFTFSTMSSWHPFAMALAKIKPDMF